jgi:hypothetical protein
MPHQISGHGVTEPLPWPQILPPEGLWEGNSYWNRARHTAAEGEPPPVGALGLIDELQLHGNLNHGVIWNKQARWTTSEATVNHVVTMGSTRICDSCSPRRHYTWQSQYHGALVGGNALCTSSCLSKKLTILMCSQSDFLQEAPNHQEYRLSSRCPWVFSDPSFSSGPPNCYCLHLPILPRKTSLESRLLFSCTIDNN